MIFPDKRTEDQYKVDLSRSPMWHGVICGNTEGRFLEDRMDFLAHTGGLVEAIQLVKEFPLTNETLPPGFSFYFPSTDVARVFEDMFGEERQVVRVMSMRESFRNPGGLLVVAPCNSKRWNEIASQTPHWDTI